MGMVEDAAEEGKPLVGDGLYSPVATTVLQKIDRYILPVFLTMATLCYLDRWVHPRHQPWQQQQQQQQQPQQQQQQQQQQPTGCCMEEQ
jgi:hypothetical protein